MISSSIIGALEKLVLVADYYDESLRMTCEVQEISREVRTILVTVNKVMVNLEDIDDVDDASMRDLEEIRLTAVRAMMKLIVPANDAA